jgi:tRNA modification GTPase
MTTSRDTIAALATPPGRGAIAIVRISGERAADIAADLTQRTPRPRSALLCHFDGSDGEPVDRGLMLYFPGPYSFTGEDVVELHGHGGTVVSDQLLSAVLARGARLADPGEFALRAFLNDKLDLAQAEAIADLIDSGSRTAARAALRSLDGEFSRRIEALQASLTALRVQVEAWIDFPDEELERDDLAALEDRFAVAQDQLANLLGDARQGAVLRSGLSVAIAGPPNAGKSSLMNRLAGYEAAIVTHIPGTTRDLLKEHIVIDGLPITIVDTAGLRESTDLVEAEGIRRSHTAMSRADRLLWVTEISEDLDTAYARLAATIPDAPPVTIVQNKIDLVDEGPAVLEHAGTPVVRLSALTGAGMELLTSQLKAIAGLHGDGEGALGARTRHVDALTRARAALNAARAQLAESRALELAAEDLRATQTALGEITGEVTSDDLLGKIFASFCIGK